MNDTFYSAKKFIVLLSFGLLFIATDISGQNNTSSLYSYFGLGELNQGGNAQNAAVGGTNLTFRGSSYLDINSPASLAGIDSLRFIFNVGLSSKFTNVNQRGESDTFHDNNISHLTFGFRVSPLVSTAISLVPYTNVGYNISTIEQVVGSDEFFTRTLKGTGGLNQFVWTNGFALTKNLYLGVNTIFLFGNNTSEEIVALGSGVNTSQQELISQGIFGNIGAQYHANLSRNWEFSLGAKFQPKVGVRSKRKLNVTNFQSNVGDTIFKNTLDRGSFDVPMTYGFGLGFTKNKRLWLGADYLHERWSKTEIFKESNELEDRDRYSVGFNYIANDGYATKFLKKLTYRFGAFYDTGYIKIEDERITTRGFSFGLGIPMAKQKGAINLSFEFGQMGTTNNDNVREDFGRLTVELSLFERWFVKRKYQ